MASKRLSKNDRECISCGATHTTLGHRSGIPLGWAIHLELGVYTCSGCNGVVVYRRQATARWPLSEGAPEA
jgi:hypothetical protein